MSTIDYAPLGKAIARLREGLEALRREPENTLYRDGVIQRFEFTYGLCASMLEREALDESRLPFKVDIVDLATLTPEFRARIEPEAFPA